MLTVRDFKQIAGRAGRKGFDDHGWVECQAPEHVIENKAAQEKRSRTMGKGKGAKGGKRGKGKPARMKSAPRGFVAWNKGTFESLVEKPPETLQSACASRTGC